MVKTPVVLYKTLVIGVILLFIATSITPSTATNSLNKDSIEKSINQFEDIEIIFEDDFNDNEKNYSKWTEIYNQGIWLEENKQTDFRLDEHPEGDKWFEGIESTKFIVPLSKSKSIIVSADMISSIEGQITTFVGRINLKITDGTNWICAWAQRNYDILYLEFIDSNDESKTQLLGRKDGTWSNSIEIFSNKYKVTMDTYDSGWIYDSIFSSNPTLTVIIYITLGGDWPPKYMRSGFDNVLVQHCGGGIPVAKFTWKPIYPKTGESITFNASDSYDSDGFIELYEWDWDNDGIFDENHTIPIAYHSWFKSGFYPVTLRVTDNTSVVRKKTRTIFVNTPPLVPTIDGPTSGKKDVFYNFTFKSLDPDGEDIFYYINWDDGCSEDWNGPHPSGADFEIAHSFPIRKPFTIRAKAKDIFDVESEWSEFEVTIPRNRATIYSLFQLFLERFPFLGRLLDNLRWFLG